MEDEKPIAAIAPNPRCTGCGYSRHGLEVLQRCPECGLEPREDEIVLWGFGHGRRATLQNATGRSIKQTMLLSNAGLLIWLMAGGYRNSPQFVIALIAFALAINLWLLMKRQQHLRELDLPEHARFTPEGCVQRTGAGEGNMIPWEAIRDVELRRLGQSLLVKCTPVFLSLRSANPIDIDVRHADVDEVRLHQQLMEWHGAHRQG